MTIDNTVGEVGNDTAVLPAVKPRSSLRISSAFAQAVQTLMEGNGEFVAAYGINRETKKLEPWTLPDDNTLNAQLSKLFKGKVHVYRYDPVSEKVKLSYITA